MATDTTPAPEAPAEAPKPVKKGRSVWRPGPQSAGWWRSRRFKRLLVLLLFLAMVAWLVVLVFPPLSHPNSQLMFLTGLDYHALRAPPLAYAQEDSDALDAIAPALDKHPEPGPVMLNLMRSATAMRTFPEAIGDATPAGASVLIVYLDAHGVSDGGTPYLLCRNYEPANPTTGRVRLRDLLRQIGDSTAAVKLLILDAGRIESDPRMGMLVNEFPRLLQQEVAATGDDSLWVLTSNAILERSHVSRALERSVFGYFVSLGLRGAADANGDRAVDADELYRFVRTNVSAWVRAASGGRESQTPLLLWGGGSDLAGIKSPVLLAATEVTGRGGFKLPKPTAKFPDVTGGIATPYTNKAQQDFVPIAAKSQKKVPGLKETRKVAKTNAKVNKKVKESKTRSASSQGNSAKKPDGAKPDAAKPDAAAGAKEETPGGESKSAAGDATAPMDGAKEPAGEGPKAGETGDAGDATAAKPSAKPAAPPPPPTAGELLAQTWQMRDDLESSGGDEPRPLDYAPLAWHEFQEWLLADEQLYRAGSMTSPKEIAAGLTKLLPRLAAIPAPPPLDKDQPPDIAARISLLRPALPAGVDSPWSLAMAQYYAVHSRTPLPADVTAAGEAIDRLATEGTLADFAAWITKLDQSLDRYSEVRWARQLARLQGLDWTTTQLALGTRRLAEQVVVISPPALPWVRERIERADKLRLSGERLLSDAIGADRQAAAVRSLRQAADLYHEAADDIAVVSGAMQLRNDLLNRLPYYLEWRQNAGWEPPPDAPKDGDLSALTSRLADIDKHLAAPVAEEVEQINKLAAELASLADRIETGVSESNIASLTGPAAGAGSGPRIELLLTTPLVSAESRQRLLAAAVEADGKQATAFRPLKAEAVFEPAPHVTPERWQTVVAQADLQAAAARLAVGAPVHDDSRNSDLVTNALAKLKAEFKPTGDAPKQTAAEIDDARWEACRRFGSALHEFYRTLPSEVERLNANNYLPADLPHSISRAIDLRLDADRMLRLADVRQSLPGAMASPPAALANRALYNLLSVQQERLEAALVDAPAVDSGYLAQAAASYFSQAEQIPLQPAAAAPANMPLVITGPTSIKLATEPEQLVELSLKSTEAKPTDVWVVCHYDPALIDVQSAGEARVYDDRHADSAGDRAKLAPTATLRAGGSESLRLRVKSKAGARQPARLIVRAITGDAISVRHEIDVALPGLQTVELAVAGPPGTWAQSKGVTSLFPFPNRKTSYRLSLVNNGAADRTVDVELLALDAKPPVVPPDAALAPDDATRLLARFGDIRSLAVLPKVALPAGGKAIPLPFVVPSEKKPGDAAPPEAAAPEAAPPASACAPAPAAAAKPDAKAAAPDEPPPPPRPVLDRGMLLVITDRDSNLKTILRIDIEPQRPRRYVRPQVGYSLDRETLEIRVVPQDKALIPEGGIKVHAEVAAALPPGTQAQFDAEIKSPDDVARLFCELPADAAKVVPVRVTVDGYPRAFVYHVPLGIQSTDLPEETDLREIRITSPEPEAAFKAPIESVMVDAQVDAPLGAFQNRDDLLEIGIDVDRDRDLRGDEPRVRLLADRQVNIWLEKAAPGGLFTLDTKVSDFHLPVPTPALRNARVSVLGRLFAGGKTGWSEPVDILLDGTAPRVERVQLKPATVVIGPDVEVSIWPTDDNLSGVVKVEAGFDTSGHGKFDDTVEPFDLTRDETGRWFSKLPTKTLEPGRITLLVRSTDRAGNVSDYTKWKCQVITKAEADAATAAPHTKLTGTVVYGNDPAADVEMTLTSEKGPKILPTKTDGSGNFSFTNLAPGKYKLAAKAVIHNKTRKTEQDVTLESSEMANPKPVRIVLK